MSSLTRMPILCAKCAERPSRHFSIDHHTTRVNYSWTMLFGRVNTTRETMTYEVPVCEDCWQYLTILKYAGVAIKGVGGLLAIVGIFIAVTDNNTTTVPFLTNLAASLNMKVKPYDLLSFIMVIVGALIIGVGALVGRPGISSTNGRTFKFKNKKFHAAFARLNPEKVKQPR